MSIMRASSKQRPARTVASLPGAAPGTAGESIPDARTRILETASRLFYERGVRAVGVDLVVEEAAVAKTSLYRYFPTKDDLIVAFLEREDVDFWAQWDRVAVKYPDDPTRELEAHMRWIGARLARRNYRGCPQINVAAEFAEHGHPARQVSRRHMRALRSRLVDIARRTHARRPERLAAQLALLVNGAFVSSELLDPEESVDVLLTAVKALLIGASVAANARD
jgi:AcrR family transcriptional regulator